MRAIRRLLVITVLLIAQVSGTAAAADPKVLLVRAEDSVAVDEFVGGLRQRLSGRAVVEEQRVGDSGPPLRPTGDVRLIVPVGVKAMRAVVSAGSSEPVLAALIPRSAYERILGGVDARRISAVFLDQPLARQLALINVALPGRTQVGILVGPESRAMLPALHRPAERFGLSIVDADIKSERDIASTLETLLNRADVLLALPDPLVHNASTLQGILLASYRRGVPVVGFSPAYTRAGALVSVHTSPGQLAEQVAEQALGAITGGRLAAPQYPREYQISVNRQVARSLAIELPDDPVLLQQVKQRSAE